MDTAAGSINIKVNKSHQCFNYHLTMLTIVNSESCLKIPTTCHNIIEEMQQN